MNIHWFQKQQLLLAVPCFLRFQSPLQSFSHWKNNWKSIDYHRDLDFHPRPRNSHPPPVFIGNQWITIVIWTFALAPPTPHPPFLPLGKTIGNQWITIVIWTSALAPATLTPSPFLLEINELPSWFGPSHSLPPSLTPFFSIGNQWITIYICVGVGVPPPLPFLLEINGLPSWFGYSIYISWREAQGFRIQGLGFRVLDSGFRIQGLEH